MSPLLRSVAALAVAAAPVAAQRAQVAYVAPNDQTIFTTTEESSGTQAGQSIFIHNRSSVAITVYSAALRNCENVKQSCSPVRLNLRVRPSGRALLLRVNPKNEFEGYRYSVSFGYRADSSNIAAIQALANAGSEEAQQRLDANAAAEAERRRTFGASDVMLDEEAITTLGAKLARMVALPESLVVRDGRAFLLRDVKLMGLDSAGALLGRINAPTRWMMPQSLVLLNSADTLLATGVGRATIRFETRAGTRTLEADFTVIVVPDSVASLAGATPADRTGSRRTRRPAAR